jgi:hypothetical protein
MSKDTKAGPSLPGFMRMKIAIQATGRENHVLKRTKEIFHPASAYSPKRSPTAKRS